MSSSGSTYDVIVIGVGAMGAATCHALARRGVRVLGLEQYDVPHSLGSSGGHTRLIRLAYHEHPDYVPLLRRAYAGWDALGEAVGTRLLYRTGGLYLGLPSSALITGALHAARMHDLPLQMLDEHAVHELGAPFRVPAQFAALHDPDTGFILCERAIAGFADQAMRHGAVVRGHEAVRAWSADARGVRVVTERGEYHGGHLVLTAGAWTGSLVRELGVTLTVTRQVLGWVWPRTPERFDLGSFPCWAIEDDAPGFQGLYYGMPMTAEHPGLKIAHHAPGQVMDPAQPRRAATARDEDSFRPCLARYLPDADGPLLSLRTCMYTMSPDHHFIVDRHPAHANVSLACGFSGHGFKFAPVMGEALADLAMHGRSELPIGFLGLARFASA